MLTRSAVDTLLAIGKGQRTVAQLVDHRGLAATVKDVGALARLGLIHIQAWPDAPDGVGPTAPAPPEVAADGTPPASRAVSQGGPPSPASGSLVASDGAPALSEDPSPVHGPNAGLDTELNAGVSTGLDPGRNTVRQLWWQRLGRRGERAGAGALRAFGGILDVVSRLSRRSGRTAAGERRKRAGAGDPARQQVSALRLQLLAPLRVPAYRLLWTGRTVSLVGDAFQLVVLPALVLDLTQRPSGLGMVLMAQAIPRALLLLAGGVVTDRFRPRPVLFVSNVLLALVVGGLLVPAAAGTLALWHVYAYAIAFGAVSAFSLPASTSIVPALLPPEQVRAGNALAMMTGNLTRFVVPPLAGLVVAAAGRPVAFAANAASFLLAAAIFWGLPARRGAALEVAPETAETAGLAGSPWEQLRDGVRAARRDAVVWSAIWLSTIFWFSYAGAVFVGLPALGKLALDAGDRGVGLLYGASGAGALLGALVAGSRASIRRPGAAACLAIAGAGLLLVPAALAPSIWAAVPFLVLSGACGAACAVLFLSLVQTRAADAVRGRVMALLTLGIFGLAPLSYIVAGVAGDAFGPRGLLAGAGLLVALVGTGALGHRALRAAG